MKRAASHCEVNKMGKTIALEIPEKEFASFGGVLDKALAALRGANNQATKEGDKRSE
jgi:hypothetical protein